MATSLSNVANNSTGHNQTYEYGQEGQEETQTSGVNTTSNMYSNQISANLNATNINITNINSTNILSAIPQDLAKEEEKTEQDNQQNNPNQPNKS